jgi:hypothetical protein
MLTLLQFPLTLLVVETGRSAARLARLLREQEVPGSNPGAPTIRDASALMTLR